MLPFQRENPGVQVLLLALCWVPAITPAARKGSGCREDGILDSGDVLRLPKMLLRVSPDIVQKSARPSRIGTKVARAAPSAQYLCVLLGISESLLLTIPVPAEKRV